MAFTKGLYYPTIDIPDDDWLKTAILFWDEIQTIVPSSIDEPYKSASTKFLANEKILNPVLVQSNDEVITSLSTDVWNYLNTPEGIDTVYRQNKNFKDEFFRIHPDKLAVEIQEFMMGNFEEGNFKFDSRFAAFYMTLLANKLCENRGVSLIAADSSCSNLSDTYKLGNKDSSKMLEYYFKHPGQKTQGPALAEGLLTNLIIDNIQLKNNNSFDDILNFKEKHKSNLGLFRSTMGELVANVSIEKPFNAILQEIEDIYKNKFLPSYDALKNDLSNSKIQWVANNFMKVSFFSTPATAIPSVLLHATIPHALIAGAGISLVTSLILYNQERKSLINKSPYSYLMKIRNDL